MTPKQIIRCHQCGTSKGDEDVGIWVAFQTLDNPKEIMIWFQSEECRDIWLDKYGDKIKIVG